MPLVDKYIDKDVTVLIWRITESYEYFLSKVDGTVMDMEVFDSMIPKRKIEWLLPRYLLYLFFGGKELSYIKDEYGKPHIGNSTREMSISHSQDMFAMIISDKRCGIDLQCYTKKIQRIAHKFVNDTEAEHLQEDIDNKVPLHYIWSAKEAIYKAYGRKQLRFKEHIHVEEILKPTVDKTPKAQVITQELEEHYQLVNLSNQEYSLIYATVLS